MNQLSFEAIGTKWQINYEPTFKAAEGEIEELVRNRVWEFERNYSRFRDDSIVANIANNSDVFQFPEDSQKLFAVYRKVYEMTGGQVTPLIGSTISSAGYNKNYTLTPDDELIKPEKWDVVMKWNYPFLTTHKPLMLDFGAAGKGYIIDIIAELLTENGIEEYWVEAGGDMRIKSETGKTVKVGLENPRDKSEAIGLVIIDNGSICASAGNRRNWGKYHHIIDPTSLSSPTKIEAVWVMAEEAVWADILTTAIFLSPVEKLRELIEFEYLILDKEFRVKKSDGFEVELF